MRRDVKAGCRIRNFLALVDAGLVRIEPKPDAPTAFVLTIPEGIPEGVLSHVT